MPSNYSVIIPTFDRSVSLERALLSIEAQSLQPSQVVVVDDSSDEDILAVVSKYSDLPIDYVRRSVRGGPSAARNSGIAKARGGIVAFLDSDDEWSRCKMAEQLAFLEQHSDIGLCCAGFTLVTPSGSQQERSFQASEYGTADLAFGCGLSPGSTLCVRREFLDLVGGFDSEFPRLEDWDWLIQASTRSRIGIVNKPLAIIHVSDPPTETKVREAVTRIRKKHSGRFFRIGIRSGLRFQAALLNELSVAAFRNRFFVRSGFYFVAAMAAYPVRNWDYFYRVGRKVVEEIRSAVGQPNN